MPWYFWLGAIVLVTAVGVVKGKRTRRKVWRAIRSYAKKRATARRKAQRKARVAAGVTRAPRRAPAARARSWQQAPLLTPKPVKRAPILRAQVCRMDCRKSVKPASTCDCVCGGRDHGRYVKGTAASIRATKYTPAQKTAQRRAEGAARNQRWAERNQAAIAKANGGRPIPRGGKR